MKTHGTHGNDMVKNGFLKNFANFHGKLMNLNGFVSHVFKIFFFNEKFMVKHGL